MVLLVKRRQLALHTCQTFLNNAEIGMEKLLQLLHSRSASKRRCIRSDKIPFCLPLRGHRLEFQGAVGGAVATTVTAWKQRACCWQQIHYCGAHDQLPSKSSGLDDTHRPGEPRAAAMRDSATRSESAGPRESSSSCSEYDNNAHGAPAPTPCRRSANMSEAIDEFPDSLDPTACPL